ncbi:UNVERIFIED_ORG: transposase [Buttiauxella agrestis ATCC 33320]
MAVRSNCCGLPETGCAWPSARDGKVFLTPAQLAMLLEGIGWRQPRRLLASLTML